jgi:hypothetical protein
MSRIKQLGKKVIDAGGELSAATKAIGNASGEGHEASVRCYSPAGEDSAYGDSWRRQEMNAEIKRIHPRTWWRPFRDMKHYTLIRAKKLAKEPCVGIFFVVEGRIYVDSLPFTENPSYAGYRTFYRNHPDFWDFLQQGPRRHPYRYEEVARGRVSYHNASERFKLFADRCIVKKKRLLRTVMGEFNLPANTVVRMDDHYQCLGCLPRRPPNLWLDREWNF